MLFKMPRENQPFNPRSLLLWKGSIASFSLISFINREKLFYASEDLLESFINETPYCTVVDISIALN